MSHSLDWSVNLALNNGLLLTAVRPRSKDIISTQCTIETFDQWRAAQVLWGTDLNAAVHLNPSNLCVVDLDVAEGYKLLSGVMMLPETMMVKSARGFHLYYRRPDDFTVGSSGEIVVAEQALGQYICGNFDFHYALLPGSIHPTGAMYRWLHLPSDGIALFPGDVHRFVEHDTGTYGDPGDGDWYDED